MDDAEIADSPLSSLVRAASVSSTCETNRNIPAKFPKQPSLKTVTACFPRVDSDPSKFYLLLSVCFGAYKWVWNPGFSFIWLFYQMHEPNKVFDKPLCLVQRTPGDEYGFATHCIGITTSPSLHCWGRVERCRQALHWTDLPSLLRTTMYLMKCGESSGGIQTLGFCLLQVTRFLSAISHIYPHCSDTMERSGSIFCCCAIGPLFVPWNT